jgi:hypothetical protein
MNIFVLSLKPKEAAKWHVNKHCVKMILEAAQLLCTAHRLLDGKLILIGKRKHWKVEENDDILYKATHVNHPCAKWARGSLGNYNWLYEYFIELCKEYTYRYEKTHLTEKKLGKILKTPPKNLKSKDLTPFAQAMPDKYKNSDVTKAYRKYYINDKNHLADWKKREKPLWFI